MREKKGVGRWRDTTFPLLFLLLLLMLTASNCRDDAVGPDPVDSETPEPAQAVSPDDAAVEEALAGGPRGDFGDPLPGLGPEYRARFDAGLEDFEEIEGPEDGLGPVFNDVSCVACHDQGGVGGAGTGVETRFGKRNPDGSFDPLSQYGGSLIQVSGIEHGDCSQPPETVPAEANIVAGRQTTPLFGLGLLDAVSERTLYDLADPFDRDRDGISGRVNVVRSPATGRMEVGRFGWKAQVPSVLVFSGDAYLNEMGITNSLFPDESAPGGGAIVCDDGIPSHELEDQDEDGNGITDGVELFTDFMRMLGPPPTAGFASASVMRGYRLFRSSQCASCHLPVLQTGFVRDVPALSRRRFFPYTDLLLHDMGSLGDGIEQGRARGSEMRTPPLWGLRVSAPYLHDGRAPTILDAIRAHEGEAQRSREAFFRLTPAQQADMLEFLSFI